jgi:hypothetical protein
LEQDLPLELDAMTFRREGKADEAAAGLLGVGESPARRESAGKRECDDEQMA